MSVSTDYADELEARIRELEEALRGVCDAFEAKGCRLEVNAAALRMTDAIIAAKIALGDLPSTRQQARVP